LHFSEGGQLVKKKSPENLSLFFKRGRDEKFARLNLLEEEKKKKKKEINALNSTSHSILRLRLLK
jgi:hypothetical protein